MINVKHFWLDLFIFQNTLQLAVDFKNLFDFK